MALWREGGLDEPAQVSLLLGGAVFHDPVLLPAYREAVTSELPRVRQAAIYGYRDLLADNLPDVRGGVNDGDAAQLGEEMEWVMRTIARRSMLELWLQALLAHDGLALPGWRGVTLERQPTVSLRAVEQLVFVEDLNLLLEAYDISQDYSTRVNLLKLVEAISLRVGVGRSSKRPWPVWRAPVDSGPPADARWTATQYFCAISGRWE
jgi:hypothetical protein